MATETQEASKDEVKSKPTLREVIKKKSARDLNIPKDRVVECPVRGCTIFLWNNTKANQNAIDGHVLARHPDSKRAKELKQEAKGA